MINLNKHKKKAQSEVIVSVLLILIGIAAVGFVGIFLTNMIRDNLKQTDCFKTTGQFNLNLGYTFFNSSNNITYVSIARGSADFNLTGFIVTIGTSQNSKGVALKSGDSGSIGRLYGYAMLDNSGVINNTAIISVPQLSETISYAINASSFSVNRVSITPILKDGKVCENKADEKEIKTFS